MGLLKIDDINKLGWRDRRSGGRAEERVMQTTVDYLAA